MYINRQWGTVCYDYWNSIPSTVLCKQLGFGYSGTFNHFGSGPVDSPIYLDDVNCYGWESNILACPHLQLSEHNCSHHQDVGVICSGLYS